MVSVLLCKWHEAYVACGASAMMGLGKPDIFMRETHILCGTLVVFIPFAFEVWGNFLRVTKWHFFITIYMNTLCFESSSLSTPPGPSLYIPHPPDTFMHAYTDSAESISVVSMHMYVGLSTLVGQPTSSPTPMKAYFLFSVAIPCLQFLNEGWSLVNLPICAGILTKLVFYRCCVASKVVESSLRVQLPVMFRRCCFSAVLHKLWLRIFLYLL